MHSILMRPVYEWGQWYTAETAESLLLLLPGMGCSAGDQGHEDTQESAVKAYREGLSPVFVIVIQGHLLVAHSAATNTTPFWEWFKILSFQWPRSPDSMSPGLGMRDLCESLKKNNDKYLYSQGSQRCTLKTRRLVHSSNSTLLSSLWSLFLTLCSTHLLCAPCHLLPLLLAKAPNLVWAESSLPYSQTRCCRESRLTLTPGTQHTSQAPVPSPLATLTDTRM